MKLEHVEHGEAGFSIGMMVRSAVICAVALLNPPSAEAQEITIPEEFLAGEPPPLETDISIEDTPSLRDRSRSPDGEGSDPATTGGGFLPEEGGDGEDTDWGENELLPGTGDGGWINRPTVELGGDYFWYFQEAPGAGDRNLVRGDLKVKFEGSLGPDIAYALTPQVRQDSGDNGVNAFEFRENRPRRPLVTFHEAYAGWLLEKFEVSVGKRIYNWGVSDAYNPLDDLNPRDFLDVPTSERIGVPSLSVYHLRDLFEVEAVWAPWFSPSRIPLPGFDNRWLGDFGAVEERAAAQLGFPARFDFAGRNLPRDRFDNGQFGGRLSSSTLIDGWDLAATYYRGRQAEGVFVGELQGDIISATLEYPRYQEIGMSFSTVIGDWQLHGEGAWHLTGDEELDDDYLEYVVGVNRTFSDVGLPGVEELRFILEYAGQEITRYTPEGSASFGSRQFARPFRDAVAGTFALKFSEETELEVSGAYDFADSGSIIQASLVHELSEHIEVKLGTDILSGPEDSFFGKWGANDRLFLTLNLVY